MYFQYSYWRSGFLLFVVIGIAIFLYMVRNDREGNYEAFFLWMIYSVIILVPAGIYTIFAHRKQRRKYKLEKMTLKEKRKRKLRKIGCRFLNT